MNKYLLSAFFLIFGYYVDAQCLVNTLTINTGYNPITGAAIAGGANGAPAIIDPHWIVTAESPGVASAITATPITGLVEVTPGSNADVVTLIGGWASNPAGNPGSWISCLNSNTYTTAGTTTGAIPYNMTMGRPFRTCVDDSIKFTLYIANDNYISSSDIDGTALSFSQPPGALTTTYGAFTFFTQTVYLTAGTHILHFVVDDYALASTVANPTGVDIYGTVSSGTGLNSLISESFTSCLSYSCTSTCSNTLSLPDTLHACIGTLDTLHAIVSGPDSIIDVIWSPATGLSTTTGLDPSLTVGTTPGWYYVTVSTLQPFNLVANGDFSSGNIDFASGYTLETPPVASTPGHYAITTNAASYSTAFPSFGDHTTGTGNMLLVDGAATASTTFWCETVPVTPNTDYNLSAWAALLVLPQPNIQVTINGVPDGTFTTATTAGLWTHFHALWNSGTATTATICFSDLNTTGDGNDFVMDDIAFQQICKLKDSIYIMPSAPDTTHSSRDTALCSVAAPLTLYAPSGYTTYTWSTGSTASSISVSTSGTYWINALNNICQVSRDTIQVEIKPSPVADLGSDIAFCQGDSAVLNTISSAGSAYLWSTGATSSSIVVFTTGAYWVSIDSNGCSKRDTVQVTVNAIPVVNLGPDIFVCDGQPVTLQSSASYTAPAYLWNTGSTTSSLVVPSTGTYWLAVTQNGCTGSDTVYVSISSNPGITPGYDTTICKGNSVVIGSPEPPGVTYLWNTGSRDSSLEVFSSGVYHLTVSQNGCSDTMSVVVHTQVPPPVITLGPDTSLCEGDALLLTVDNYFNDSVLWNTGSTSTSITVTQAGFYSVKEYNQCGYSLAAVNVDFAPCNIWIPSAFTPNDDGKNDIIRVGGSLKFYQDFSFSIFNRFGQRVFYTDNIHDGWNGIFNGTKQDLGTYFYVVFYSLDGKEHMMKGDFELIR